eukprot:TRINITY_DN23416_c0_g1_i2.p1 TRINITY_DN23416_c0_g1~~TRINITY_DN23416_c0_g1_i2.p1  ORF type:complete len:368 (+),score=44.88 TRINITY_DN23416_c0_g1_i2:654-1757(+)
MNVVMHVLKYYRGGVVFTARRAEVCDMSYERWEVIDGTVRFGIEAAPLQGHAMSHAFNGQDQSIVKTNVMKEEKQQIKQLEARIREAQNMTVSDKELIDIDNQLDELKRILLNDIMLQDPASPAPDDYPLSGLGDVIDEQLCELLLDEFGADLANFRRTQVEFGLKLSLLVEQRDETDGNRPSLDLIGFLAYKTWGPPAPGVSIGAVGVASRHRGKGYGRDLMKVAEDRASLLGMQTSSGFVPGEVRLRSLATAVQFYERLGYERVHEGPDAPAPERTPGCPDPEALQPVRESTVEDDEAPCVPMVRRCAPFSPRARSRMLPLLSPKQDPWSPTRARALEDGPTWPRVDELCLPESVLPLTVCETSS